MDDNARLSNMPVFDAVPPPASLYLTPQRPEPPNDGAVWYTGALTPELIDELVETVAVRCCGLEAIVISGLERYPVPSGEWPRWLARWARCTPPALVVMVDTEGWSDRCRRQLIARTRRRAALQPSANPVMDVARRIQRWISGSMA